MSIIILDLSCAIKGHGFFVLCYGWIYISHVPSFQSLDRFVAWKGQCYDNLVSYTNLKLLDIDDLITGVLKKKIWITLDY